MQDHASAIFQRDELAYREALGTHFVGALRPEIAEGAKPYDAAWLDRGKIRVIVDGVRVRVPAALQTAHQPTVFEFEQVFLAVARSPEPPVDGLPVRAGAGSYVA
jgi:hypothetical protein